MTLTAIRAMFRVDSIWTVERARPWKTERDHTKRRVARLSSSQIIWDTGYTDPLYTDMPKAAQVIQAADGLLVMTYTDKADSITFRRVDDAAAAEEIRSHLRSKLELAKQVAATFAREEARLKAERENADRKAAFDTSAKCCREGTPMTPRMLIDFCAELGIDIPIQTKGALLRKTHQIGPDSFSFQKGKRPRFTEHPSHLYCQARDTLAARENPQPEEDEPVDPVIHHLFHRQPAAPPPARALLADAFA